MLRNYLIVAFRTLRRQRLYSAVNVSGLALGPACCCLLVASWVRDETGFDRFHRDAAVTYRVNGDARDFLLLVLIGAVIAAQAANPGMHRWLQGCTHHTTNGSGVSLASGALALVVALATVSWQALRVASTDPVQSLRSE